MSNRAAVATAYAATLENLADHAQRSLALLWASLATYDDIGADQFHATATAITTQFATAAANTTSGYLLTITGTPPPPAPQLFVADAAARCFDPFDRLGRLLADGTPYQEAVTSGQAVAEALGSDSVYRTARSTMGAISEGSRVQWQRRLQGKCCPWCMKLSSVVFDSAGQATFGHANCRCLPVPADVIGDHNTAIRDAEGFDPQAEKLYDQRHARKRLRDSAKTATKRSEQAARDALTEPDPLRRDRLETRAQEWETRAEAASERLRIMETGTHRLPGQLAA